jgi:non-canonical (house-cleaning) NTP pyrophosphatase
LYLGLIHHEDGVEGAHRRARAAASAQSRFGVATECGFGRGPSERTVPLLQLHAAVALPWAVA